MPLQRPIGFDPSEISKLVNLDVVAQHAEETAFLWTLRNRAVTEPHYSLDDIARLDERVDAHFEGLQLAGDEGWRFAKANLENLGPGEVFAAGLLAFSAGHRDRMRESLLASVASLELTSGLISALGWLDYPHVSEWIYRLLETRTPAHRVVGLRAAAVHREDAGPWLAAAVEDHDPLVRATALRCVGELRRADLIAQAFAAMRSDDEACRFWAAWALTLNGEPDGFAGLSPWMMAENAFAERAAQAALRAMPLEDARNWIRSWVSEPKLIRLALKGVGIVGDPASVPWLIAKMANPEFARLAGESFSMITGVDLGFSDLDEDGPDVASVDESEPSEDLVLADQGNLPWPSHKKVADWWDSQQQNFVNGVRYLAGKPIEEPSLRHTLKFGKQRQRTAAALELLIQGSDRILFETRARGAVQQRKLG